MSCLARIIHTLVHPDSLPGELPEQEKQVAEDEQTRYRKAESKNCENADWSGIPLPSVETPCNRIQKQGWHGSRNDQIPPVAPAIPEAHGHRLCSQPQCSSRAEDEPARLSFRRARGDISFVSSAGHSTILSGV